MGSLTSKKRTGSRGRSNQSTLLDQCGTPQFRFDTDVRLIAGSPGEFEIAGMKIVLVPPPSDEPRAVGVVVDCLRELWVTSRAWRDPKADPARPTILDVWNGYSCTATFRNSRDDGVIRAVLVAPWRIELSLPHSTMWGANGLAWLASFENCCKRNRSNPTPWLGAPCDCPIAEHY
jgi:hypothetical protein